MKLRMQGNSVRLRLTRSEVAQFAATGIVEETVQFPSSNLRYALRREPGDRLTASFEQGTLTVTVPDPDAQKWTSGDQVGIGGSAGPLAILIEKDFQCAHDPQDADAFTPERLS